MSEDFAGRLLSWFDQHGRHDLPWQHPREPYRVWLSEIMLQQTQVTTVIPYFERFLKQFPDIGALAAASLDEVLALWAGLGYYARARNLHRCAQVIVAEHGGQFPRTLETMLTLPGIGRSTAGAILAQAFGAREAILDGNVRRVLSRHAAVAGWPGETKVQRQLWAIAEAHLPTRRLADYTQALMDLGATVCIGRNPVCRSCPVSADCQASTMGAVADFPTPRPRRLRPQRQAQLLLLSNAAGELLLERRPPTGIWGGLWSPPFLETTETLEAWGLRRGLQLGEPRRIATIRHAFSHFDLEIQPLEIATSRMDSVVADPGNSRWFRPHDLLQLGLPAPISKLIHSRDFLSP